MTFLQCNLFVTVPGCSCQYPIYFWCRRDNNRQTLFSSIVSSIDINVHDTIDVWIGTTFSRENWSCLFLFVYQLFACLFVSWKQILQNPVKKGQISRSMHQSNRCIQQIACNFSQTRRWNQIWGICDNTSVCIEHAPRWNRCASTIPRALHQPCPNLSKYHWHQPEILILTKSVYLRYVQHTLLLFAIIIVRSFLIHLDRKWQRLIAGGSG